MKQKIQILMLHTRPLMTESVLRESHRMERSGLSASEDAMEKVLKKHMVNVIITKKE